MKSNRKTKPIILIILGILFAFLPLINNNLIFNAGIGSKTLEYCDDINLEYDNLHISQVSENPIKLILKNNYVYDYPNTQSEWWGNAEAVMDPSNQTTDGFFVSRSAGGYYSNQKKGLLIRFDTNGNVEWLKTTGNSLYPAAMVTALPNEKSVMGCYHYNYDYVDFFSYNKTGDSIYNWTYDPLETVKLVAMKWSNGLWAVGDIETPIKGVFLLKMDYIDGSVLVSNTWNLGVDTNVVGICSDNNGGLYLTGWLLNNSKHQLFVAHSNSSGDILSSNIIYDEQFNVQGAACTYDGVNLYVVGPYQVEIGQDKSNSYVWYFDSNCSLQDSVTITSEGKYGIGYFCKSTLDDMSWIYFNYDIKILNTTTGELVVSDVIEKDWANTMIHLLNSSLNEIDYYEYKSDSPTSNYHDACGKLIITKYGKLFSVMFCSRIYSDHPYIRIVEYSTPSIYITIKSPSTYEAFGPNAPNFNITIDYALPINTTWYTINEGQTNYTFSGFTGTVNQTAWDNKGTEEIMTLRFYANDTLGHLGFKDVLIWKDLVAPQITINSPTPNQLCGVYAPTFSLTIVEPNIQIKRYSLNGRPNITFTTQTQFSQPEWDNIGNGTVLITFYVIDKVGNMNSSEVIVRKDAYIPDIIIHSPIQDEVFRNTPPEFNISIIEEDLVSTWYTIENIVGNFPFSELSGSFDQDAWMDVPEGEITITFYALDRAGNIGTESIIVIKYIPAPPTGIFGIIPGIIGSVSALLVISLIIWAIFNEKKRKKAM